MTRLEVNGLGLNIETSGKGPPLLLLHGFTGNLETWRHFLPLWDDYRCIAIDVIGHGLSDAPLDEAPYTVEAFSSTLLALLDKLDAPRTYVLGYSMGGRLALRLALDAPERVAGLILESASPGIAEDAERAARLCADQALADNIERDGVPAFVDRWQANPLFDSQSPALRSRLRKERLRSSAIGLANSLRGMGAGRQEPLWSRLPSLAVPTLLVTGALDAKYCDISQRMASLLPDVQREVVAGAGHAVHLERPQSFAALVCEFLAQRDHMERATLCR